MARKFNDFGLAEISEISGRELSSKAEKKYF